MSKGNRTATSPPGNVARGSEGRGRESQPRRWNKADAALESVRGARRRYWVAREGGDPREIAQALREWVDAQKAAAESELETRGWVVEEKPLHGGDQ